MAQDLAFGAALTSWRGTATITPARKRPAHIALIVAVCGILIYLSGNSFLQLTPKAIVCLVIYYGLVALNLIRVRAQYRKDGKEFGGLKADYDPYWVEEEARLAAEEEAAHIVQ